MSTTRTGRAIQRQPGGQFTHWTNPCGQVKITYATSGRVISGDRRCNVRSGLVSGTVFHVATAVPASASITSRTRCGVVMDRRAPRPG